jgi:hypothetical protein
MAQVNFLAPGFLTGLFSVASTISTAAGHPALGAFFSDPQTATEVQNVVSAVTALFAGFLPGVTHTPPPKAALPPNG